MTQKAKRFRPKKPEDFLYEEPYRSIINIFMFAPASPNNIKNGFKAGELRYLLAKDKESIKKEGIKLTNIPRMKYLNSILFNLQYDSRINLYQNDERLYSPQKFNRILSQLENGNHGGWIERKGDFCFLVEKYKYKFLKDWHMEILKKANVENILLNTESMFLFPSDNFNKHLLSDIDRWNLDQYTAFIFSYLNRINKIFERAAIHKANDIWGKFIKNFDSPYCLKEFIWINLIGQYFSETLALKKFNPAPDVLKAIYTQAKDDVKLFYKDLDLKDNDFKKINFNNDIINTYKSAKRRKLIEYFSYEIIENASIQYIEKSYKIVLNDYINLSSQIVVTRIIHIAKTLKQDFTNYLMIYENPFFLSDIVNTYDIQKDIESLLNCKNINCIKKNLCNNGYVSEEKTVSQKIDKLKDRYELSIKMKDPMSYILDKYSYQQRTYNLNTPNKKEGEKMKNTFFSESGILKKYKNKIKKLGLDYKEIINKLDSFSNNFDIPEEKS